MRVFQIREDQFRKKAGCIEATHKWGLPGVICPVCSSTWSAIGLEYPSIDLTDFADERLYREHRAEPLSEFLRLKKKIADTFPKLPVLKPGTQFGISVGKSIGKLDGFVWRAWWTIVLEINALKKLEDSGLSLPKSVKAELAFKKEIKEVFEFDLPLEGKLANRVYDGIQLNYCAACGRDSAKMPEEILINASSIPNDLDIFRVSNFTTIILVTERFVNTVANLNITGAVFEEVKTV